MPLFKRSSVYTVLGDKRSAVEDLTNVIRLNPTLKQAREKRANLLMAQGNLDLAAEDLQVSCCTVHA